MYLICSIFFLSFLALSMILYLLGLYFLSLDLEVFVELNLLTINSLSVTMVLYFDWASLLFMSFVFFISSMIIKYSDEYMKGDLMIKRFILLMFLFVLSMMFLIFSLNLISLLLGWDGLGLVSYALVVYYQNEKSYNAGMLTALSNRVGDAALLMGIACMMDIGGWNFHNYLELMKENKSMILVVLLMILAAITKSAQMPFSAWLPAAMAAPTPVSSLVHSSTLVTAGVYLLFRFSPMFSSVAMDILLYGSLFTMFMAGMGANFENDLKKIIALSTLSQLGMMISIMCLGSSNLAYFHLLIHALFKALLFMCAGAIIHNLGNCQDIRYMGGLIYYLPMTCICMNISNLALCGLPFLSGFYSKDLIAEVLSASVSGFLVYLVFFLSVGLTVSYSIRLTYYLFWGDFNLSSLNSLKDDNNKIMLNGMLGLIFLVIFKGSMFAWLLFPTPCFVTLPFVMKIMTLLMIMFGAILGYELSFMKYIYMLKSLYLVSLAFFLATMWNLPILSTFGLNSYFLKLGKTYSKSVDQGWMEYYGSKGLFDMLKTFTKNFQLLSSNHLKFFLLLLLLLFLFFVGFIML